MRNVTWHPSQHVRSHGPRMSCERLANRALEHQKGLLGPSRKGIGVAASESVRGGSVSLT